MPLAIPAGMLIALLFGVLALVLPPVTVIAVLLGVTAVVTVMRKDRKSVV